MYYIVLNLHMNHGSGSYPATPMPRLRIFKVPQDHTEDGQSTSCFCGGGLCSTFVRVLVHVLGVHVPRTNRQYRDLLRTPSTMYQVE